jgi:predicted nucleotidyltransferase
VGTSVEQTVAHLRRRARDRATRGAERRAELERWLPTAREILRSRGAESVYAFGSVVSGRTTAGSDLDLAVAGLPRSAYFAALGELMRTLPCEVDLVRLEEAPESLRERVRAEGREL